MKSKLAIERLKGETLATLTARGRGVELEQICIWSGLSSYGTSKNKAVRLLAWYDNKMKVGVENETP